MWLSIILNSHRLLKTQVIDEENGECSRKIFCLSVLQCENFGLTKKKSQPDTSNRLQSESIAGADPEFGQGGPQLPRPNVADAVEQSHVSKASYLRLGSRARLRSLEASEFLVLKYAFFHILESLFLSFLISTSKPKTYNYY